MEASLTTITASNQPQTNPEKISTTCYRTRSSVLIPRLALGTLILTAILLPSLYQPGISSLYKSLYHWKVYNFSCFETIETFLCYITIEPLFTAKFARNPSLRIDIRHSASGRDACDALDFRLPRMKRPSRRLREMATYIAPLILLDLTLIKKFAGVSIEDIRSSGGYDPIPGRDGRISAFFLLPTFHNFSLNSPLQLRRGLPAEPPSSRRLVLELITSLFIYDALFFFLHLLFHRIPVLHQIHGPHHGHGEINPQVTNLLSVPERLSLILLANFALNIIGSHVLTRTAFIPIFVYLLVEVHCGLDLDWGCEKVLPLGWGAGSERHATHHREGKRFYEPFFRWWDDGLEFLENKWGRMI